MTIEPQTKVPPSGFPLLGFVTANSIGLNLAVLLAIRWITHRSWHGIYFLDGNFHQLGKFFRGLQLHDSWDPMLAALHSWQAFPSRSIYQSIFFTAHIKFQYPLPSLLPFALLNRIGQSDPQIIHVAGAACWISVGLVALLGVLVGQQSAPRTRSSNRNVDLPEIFAIVLGTLFFFPLLKGCTLGQVQTILTLGFTAAFYCWLRGNEALAGALIGVMAMIKPQYALLLLWAALRKRWGALSAGLACIAIIMPLSIWSFGWNNNLEYLDVLRALSTHGESFFANQSMNGLLNRLLFNGTNLTWQTYQLPPFRWSVYAGTVLSALLLIAVALFFRNDPTRSGGVADFSCMAVAATAAAPIAWEHHYGILLPIFVWLWFGEFRGRSTSSCKALLVSAYVLTSDCLSPVNVLWHVPTLNVLQSYTYFGVLFLLFLLLRLRSSSEEPERRALSPVSSIANHAAL